MMRKEKLNENVKPFCSSLKYLTGEREVDDYYVKHPHKNRIGRRRIVEED